MYKKITIFSIIFFILDQVSKLVMENILTINKQVSVIKNFFNITLCHNKGIAWSMLYNKKVLIIILTIIALGVIVSFIKEFNNNKRNIFAFSLLLGGLLGNLVDRIIHGYVIDFFDFKIFNYDYPVFNLADTFIVVAVFLLIISILKGDGNSENNSK